MILKAVGWIVVAWWIAVAGYQVIKPLPQGVNVAAPVRRVPESSVRFLADYTFIDANGQRKVQQSIFNEVFAMVDRAEQFIVLDMFLFNDFQGANSTTARPLARELTEHLIAKRQQRPDVDITVVTDPVNTVYGGDVSPYLTALQEAGVTVVTTNLSPLRDSNPFYASLWRTYLQWWGNGDTGGRLAHPFSTEGQRISVRSYLALLNFKANHRKLIVADEAAASGTKLITLITSANPHDGSSAHGNVALQVRDKIWFDVVQSEQAALKFSGGKNLAPPSTVHDEDGSLEVQLVTERAIREALLRRIRDTQTGDRIDMAMFYLSDRSVVRALIAASRRGVAVRLILDPNKDAFGRTKSGIPNRPVAHELLQRSDGAIALRWCDTHGEQCHSKLTLIQRGDAVSLLLGSANLTKRNVGNYNLESNVLVEGPTSSAALAEARRYFDALWHNTEGRVFTVEYATYADGSLLKKLLYRIQERTGISSF